MAPAPGRARRPAAYVGAGATVSERRFAELKPMQQAVTRVDRCPWAESSEAMRAYHDHEWGKPSRDERHLFEMLILEGAQAGLSWATILAKRENYRQALDGFDPSRASRYDDVKMASLLENPGIVRNRLKLRSVVRNAQAYLEVAEEWGSFGAYLWAYVGGAPIVNRPTTMSDVLARSELSDQVSKDLKRRGFTFVGSTIVYSYLQSVGVVDDHLVTCASKPG